MTGFDWNRRLVHASWGPGRAIPDPEVGFPREQPIQGAIARRIGVLLCFCSVLASFQKWPRAQLIADQLPVSSQWSRCIGSIVGLV